MNHTLIDKPKREDFGVRISNRPTNHPQPGEKVIMMYHCPTCGTTNNMFRTPDGRIVCVLCRMEEIGLRPRLKPPTKIETR